MVEVSLIFVHSVGLQYPECTVRCSVGCMELLADWGMTETGMIAAVPDSVETGMVAAVPGSVEAGMIVTVPDSVEAGTFASVAVETADMIAAVVPDSVEVGMFADVAVETASTMPAAAVPDSDSYMGGIEFEDSSAGWYS